MAAIITIRQEILVGAKAKATSLTVKNYDYKEAHDKVVFYELLDGRKGILPLQNIAAICELKEN
jgi:hypothetical protein